jgi:hypothetical protein
MTVAHGPGQPAGLPQRTSAWYRLRLIAALLCLLAAVAVVSGSFLTLYSGRVQLLGKAELGVAITGWSLRVETGADRASVASTAVKVAQNGFPLTIAGALLFIATLFGVVAARRSAPPVIQSGAVLTASIAAAFLAGTVWTIGMQLDGFAKNLPPMGALPGNDNVESVSSLGLGFALLLAGAVVAIVAAVLAAFPRPAG